MRPSIFLSSYAFISYACTIGAWVFVALRRRAFDAASIELSKLPKADRLNALKIFHGPIPEEISADQWIRDRKNKIVLAGFIATLAAITPLALLSLSDRPAKAITDFFGVTGQGRLRPSNGAGEDEAADNSGADMNTDIGSSTGSEPEGGGRLEGPVSPESEEQRAVTRINVGSAVDGVLSKVVKRLGDDVKEGDTIAVIARADLAAELKSAEAAEQRARKFKHFVKVSTAEQLRVAKLEVESARSVLTQAQQHQERLKSISSKDVYAQRVLEDAKTSVLIAQKSIELAEARAAVTEKNLDFQRRKAEEDVGLAGERLELARAQAARVEIKAPAPGKIRSIMKVGEAVLSDKPVAVIELEEERPTPRSSGR